MSDKETDVTKKPVASKTAAKKPAAKSTKTAPSAKTSKEQASKAATTKAAAKTAAPKKTAATGRASAQSSNRTSAAKAGASKAAASKTAARKAAPRKTGATSSAGTSTSDPTIENTETKAEETVSANSNQNGATEKMNDAAKIVEELKGRNWPKIIQRALLMFFFGVLGTFALYLSFVLAVAQIGFTIFAGSPNDQLSRIIRQCGLYIKDVLDYLSFEADDCPFPFGRDLPSVD